MLRVPLFDDECLTSYCARFAAANLKTATELCSDMGIGFQNVIDGSDAAIFALAEYAWVTPKRLQEAAVVNVKGAWKVRGELFHRRFYTRTKFRFCPECFLEDDKSTDRMPGTRRYIRRHWALRFLRTCPQHHCRMVDLGTGPLFSRRNHDFIECMEEMFDEISEAMSHPCGQEISEYERFLLTRLDGVKHHGEVLDEMPLNDGAYLCELMGQCGLFGFKLIEDLNESQLQMAAEYGYVHLRESFAGLKEILDVMHNRISSSRPDVGGQKLYGPLYTFLQSQDDPVWDKIKTIIREYAFETLSLSKSADIFGKRDDADFLSDGDIKELTGFRPGNLRKVGVASGLLDPSLIKRGPVPKDVAKQIVSFFNDWLLPVEAAAILGVKYFNFKHFKNAGFFTPAFSSGNGVDVYERYSRKELDEYIAKIRRLATHPTRVGLRTINATAKALGCRITEIIELLHDETLKIVAWDESEVGLAAVLVDPSEVSPLVVLQDHGHLPVYQLAKSWKMSTEAVLALVNVGALPTVVGVNIRKRNRQRLITHEHAASFQAKYVTFLNASRDFNVTRTRLREALKRANLLPLFPVEEVRAQFYHRDEVEVALRNIENVELPLERKKSLDAISRRAQKLAKR